MGCCGNCQHLLDFKAENDFTVSFLEITLTVTKYSKLVFILPVPMPLSTAPSLTPEALVLLEGVLWVARLGRNRHLHETPEDRLTTGNSCKAYNARPLTYADIRDLQQNCCSYLTLPLRVKK